MEIFPPYLSENFNPLPPHGGRHVTIPNTITSIGNFNPLPPHGGRLINPYTEEKTVIVFQSTPSAWRETQTGEWSYQKRQDISIHSLRMEGD